MCIPATVSQAYITDQLHKRPVGPPDYFREKLALRDIARQMMNNPTQILPRLVDLAIELCGATSGGLSLYEPDGDLFRWHHLRGRLERFTGATTPRDDSPCGITLDTGAAVLVQHPERVYSWLLDAKVSIPECLLVPLYVGEAEALGTLWIVSETGGHFNAGHASLMQELAGFTGIALQMIRSEERLKAALEEQEILAREMGHRVKNLFAIADGMIRSTARSAGSTAEMATELSGRLHALASANALIRRTFASLERTHWASDFAEVIDAVLKPYSHSTTRIAGPPVALGEHATNLMALVFHELATNAAKYGALGAESGAVSVTWTSDDSSIGIVWSEAGGPSIDAPPEATGFGTSLVTRAVERQGGKIERAWHPGGVQVNISIPLKSLAP